MTPSDAQSASRPTAPAPADLGAFLAARLTQNIARAVVGKAQAVELLLVALICEGHVLLEDVPGVGKTLLAKAMARSLGCSFKRIQFTPDLLPSDITGSQVFDQRTSTFEFRPGPLFANIILADEVNRATPRTQSALLEAMEERQVTADGVTMPLPRPFLVLATQNPIELEGTFPLPEAQLDRFFLRLRLGYPTEDEESAILQRVADADPLAEVAPVLGADDKEQLRSSVARVHVADVVRAYLVALVRATRGRAGLNLGASPRASLALFRGARALACIRGNSFVRPDDIKALAPAVLGHRIILSAEARLKARDAEAVVAEILSAVKVPAEDVAAPGHADTTPHGA
jgi:MoxR-like ATPase